VPFPAPHGVPRDENALRSERPLLLPLLGD
jgi:hypothetical protein